MHPVKHVVEDVLGEVAADEHGPNALLDLGRIGAGDGFGPFSGNGQPERTPKLG